MMKKMLALLLALLLALPSGLALAETKDASGYTLETYTSLFSDILDSMSEKAEEVKDAVSEKVQDVIDTVSEKLPQVLDGVSEKAEDVKDAVSGEVQDVVDTLSEKLPQFLDGVSEKAGDLKDSLSRKVQDVIDTLSEKLSQVLEAASEKAEEIKRQLSEKVLETIIRSLPEIKDRVLPLIPEKYRSMAEYVLNALTAQDPDELIARAKEALPVFWNNVKNAAAEKAGEFKDVVLEEGMRLLAKLLGIAPEDDEPVVDPEPTPEDKPAADPEPSSVVPSKPEAPLSRAVYFDAFYLGMPVSEAKALGTNAGLGDAYVDEKNAAQCFTLALSGDPRGFAYFLFSGLNDDAPLTEILCVYYSGADAVTETENGPDIQTTEETVNAVYDAIEAWFKGCPSVELGGKLAFPTHANLWDDEQSVSRAKLYLTADGDGFDAATHYVYTADCGLNILQYRYVDANQAAALLAK